jgi:hypothetical protein
MKIKTVATMWAEYSSKAYPSSISDMQREETKQAFYAGMFSLLGYMLGDIAEMSDDRGVVELESLNQEVRKYLSGRMTTLISRNN